MAFGGDGSGGGNMVPSLELATVPGVDKVGLVAEEVIVVRGGAVGGEGFGELEEPVADGLRTIRAFGGMVMA
jgi:hypothetical protein